MNWDVVDIEPEPDWTLQVRFADGVAGKVRFWPQFFTGLFEPVRDPAFFRRYSWIMARWLGPASLTLHRTPCTSKFGLTANGSSPLWLRDNKLPRILAIDPRRPSWDILAANP